MEGIPDTDLDPAVEESKITSEITSYATTMFEPTNSVDSGKGDGSTTFLPPVIVHELGESTHSNDSSEEDGSGIPYHWSPMSLPPERVDFEDGSAAFCPWSLSYKQQVHNLKKNWKWFWKWNSHILGFPHPWRADSWCAQVVEKFRNDLYLDKCELEMNESFLKQFFPRGDMDSLDLAILIQDLKMVQKILERYTFEDNVTREDVGSAKEFVRLKQFDDTPTKIDIFYTPLHLAVMGGNRHIMDMLLDKGINVNGPNWLGQTPLHLVCKLGNVTMLQSLAKDRYVAVQDANEMQIRPSLNVNAVDCKKKTPLHYLATQQFQSSHITNIIKYLAQDKALDMKALDDSGLSAFYVAVLHCNTQFVIVLLESFKDQIRLNEACDDDLGPPIQIVFEGGDSFKGIERALMECEPIKGYMEMLYRDRQVYVDAANAILVGAALIASVTFASWLQPPLNYTSYFGEGQSSSIPTPSTSDLNYVDVEHNIPLRAFWVFNALSFYFAIGTVVCGARSVLPRSRLFITKTVENLRTNLLVTLILLACSVLFVIIAFAIAGTIVLTPLLKYQWYMIVPTIVGGMVCIISLGFLVKSMAENSCNIHDISERLDKKKARLC